MKITKRAIVVVVFSIWMITIATGNTVIEALDLQYDERVAWRSVVFYLIVFMGLPVAIYGAILSNLFHWSPPSIVHFTLAQATVFGIAQFILRRMPANPPPDRPKP